MIRWRSHVTGDVHHRCTPPGGGRGVVFPLSRDGRGATSPPADTKIFHCPRLDAFMTAVLPSSCDTVITLQREFILSLPFIYS